MTKLNIYLNFAGNTEEAFNFYKSFLVKSLALLFVSKTCRWKVLTFLKKMRIGAAQKRRAASSTARKKPQGTLTDNIVNTRKTLGLAAIAAWGIVTLAGKAIERRA